MQAAHHGADRARHDVGDLLVGELFHVAQDDGELELLRQRVERAANLALDDGQERDLLRVAQLAHRGGADPAVGERVGVRPLEQGLLETPAAVLVDEGVREDAEEPRLEVRPHQELVASPHRLHERVLNEVFGLGRVPGEAAGDPVHGVHVREGFLGEGVGILGVFFGCFDGGPEHGHCRRSLPLQAPTPSM